MRASNSDALAFPKGRPRVLEQRDRRSELNAIDRQERRKCKTRSGGRCEIILVTHRPETSSITQLRCKRSARENHHLLGGNGRRNVGPSILSIHRIEICAEHHREINAALLEPYREDENHLAATVRYIEVQR